MEKLLKLCILADNRAEIIEKTLLDSTKQFRDIFKKDVEELIEMNERIASTWDTYKPDKDSTDLINLWDSKFDDLWQRVMGVGQVSWKGDKLFIVKNDGECIPFNDYDQKLFPKIPKRHVEVFKKDLAERTYYHPVVEILGLSKEQREKIGTQKLVNLVTYPDFSLETTDVRNISIYNTRPVLFPIEQLTAEIEIDGRKFIPILEYVKEFYPNDYQIVGSGKFLWIKDKDTETTEPIKLDIIHSGTIESFSWLRKYHFDVYGLCELGLAIPVKSWFNPYK